ncbi:undecaprenyl-diphosphate phosphatase [Planotetraspora phitsanulokensis]|uniref:Undecaprenyl-diphosphatase n=1 Tax=Planotetraspora phitsanulokensis TaxID=575192 RepID=A0A8J3XD02_9ACTN|nr:undecaprenyl-diphosphate phosphatase [Planotetraspora phitsanulokensis]GII36096.1 undecaprenyl-diphosphatase [Planotetraspora phitsanulokensis]
MSAHLSYLEALAVGALQGITELFPVSSLGHSVLLPALVGGRWADDLNVSTPESPYLAFVVGLHVATALALMLFFWRDWLRIVTGFVTSIRHRRIATADERLAWMIIIATIPVGVTGLLLEHTFRTVLGRPLPAAVFLALNGVILYGAELLRRRTLAIRPATTPAMAGAGVDAAALGSGDQGTTDLAGDRRLAARSWRDTTLIGTAQVLALLPGISRSGATMAAGLFRGLDHDDAARFSFLLATPVILAAGVLKLPDLFGPLGDGIHGQVLAGSAASFVCAYLAVRFLTRYFQTRTLIPFAVYCTAAGVASFAWLATR